MDRWLPSQEFSSIPSNLDKKEAFHILSNMIKACHKCQGLNVLGVTENAPGFGNLNSKIVIVGQSLCRKCMTTQIPFTGGSGRLLDKAFKLAGMSKSDIFITNVVHCHTPDNRKSLPNEIANCRPFLLQELAIVRPKAIIPLGLDATTAIIGDSDWPSVVGKKVSYGAYTVYPMYHPSYIMKQGKKSIQAYIRLFADILKKEIR